MYWRRQEKKKEDRKGRKGGREERERREINDQLLQEKILNFTGNLPKSKLRYHLTLIRLINVNNPDNTPCWQGGRGNSHLLLVEVETG